MKVVVKTNALSVLRLVSINSRLPESCRRGQRLVGASAASSVSYNSKIVVKSDCSRYDFDFA